MSEGVCKWEWIETENGVEPMSRDISYTDKQIESFENETGWSFHRGRG